MLCKNENKKKNNWFDLFISFLLYVKIKSKENY